MRCTFPNLTILQKNAPKIGAALLIAIMAGCATKAGNNKGSGWRDAKVEQKPSLACKPGSSQCTDFDGSGFSGMTQIDAGSYLVVHDRNIVSDGSKRNRLGILQRKDGKYAYHAIKDGHVKNGLNWQPQKDPYDPRVVANDLESACAIGNNQFLVAESSGHKNVKRIFHIELEGLPGPEDIKANIVRVLETPKFHGAQEPSAGDYEYEGMDCLRINTADGASDNNFSAFYLVVIGARGGSWDHPLGTLRWGTYSPTYNRIDWDTDYHAGIAAPGRPNELEKEDGDDPSTTTCSDTGCSPGWRDISGLLIDENLRIWATAAFDGDPDFMSVVYQLGAVCIDQNARPDGLDCSTMSGFFPRPILKSNLSVAARLHGHKLEAIAAPFPDATPRWNVASEDENDPTEVTEYKRKRANGAWWPYLKR